VSHDPVYWVIDSTRVRVRSGALGCEQQVMTEGKVVAYSASPQILVEADDGTKTWWSVNLPIDVLGER
jgi:hypothetical protein